MSRADSHPLPLTETCRKLGQAVRKKVLDPHMRAYAYKNEKDAGICTLS